jgi:two-component system cell cycle response regulator DivK
MAKKILIIDDDRDAISFVQCILEDHGYESIGSLSSVTALETARFEKPDLILLDLFMPEKSGIGVFKELKEDPDLKHIPVVVVSGMPQVTGVDVSTFIGRQIDPSGNGVSARSTTPEGLVDKPIEPDKLISLIRKIMNEGDT